MGLLQLCVFVLFVTQCHSQDKHESGLYNITVTSIGQCEDGGTNEVKFHTKIYKMAKDKICYSGWIYLPYGMTDDQQEVWEVSTRGSTGGWKANFLRFKNKRACSDQQRQLPEWFNILKNANLNDTSCPIPKGNYTFTCVDFSNLQFATMTVLVYGTYRVTVRYYHNKVNVGCTTYQGEVHPRVNATSTPDEVTTGRNGTDGSESEEKQDWNADT